MPSRVYRPARLLPSKPRAAWDAAEAVKATIAAEAAAAAAASADERVSIAKPENPPLGRTLGPPERLRRSNSSSYLYGGSVAAVLLLWWTVGVSRAKSARRVHLRGIEPTISNMSCQHSTTEPTASSWQEDNHSGLFQDTYTASTCRPDSPPARTDFTQESLGHRARSDDRPT